MNENVNEVLFFDWIAEFNYNLMQWTNDWWWMSMSILFFTGSLIAMSPLSAHQEHSFIQIMMVWLRRLVLLLFFVLATLPLIMFYIYDITAPSENTLKLFFNDWFFLLAFDNWYYILGSIISGLMIRFIFNRYCLTFFSKIYRGIRKSQIKDKVSNIIDESKKYKPKSFVPKKYYSHDSLTIGIDKKNKPVSIPWDTWKENMMQIIGPTGFGKGVILGCIADQVIENGQTVFSINPKRDKFLPYIMHNAAKRNGRKFYYVSLREGELGSWGPFMGGDSEDAFTRLMMAFKLELTGEPKTDFYKRQEIKGVRRAFKKTRRIDGLYNEICGEGLETAEAELEVWKDFKTLCPPSKRGFSIAKAIEENAVVYVQGSLDHPVVKTATKIFIAELMQECRRTSDDGIKKNHTSILIDETSFLMSKVVKEALATIRSYGVTIVNAYQAPDDLLNIDDDSVDGKSLKQSMNINSQLKAIYGGADFELAEWAALMSGTITKEVTKMEKTDIQAGGAETWEDNRTIGTIEENLIHPNVLLSLPKSVCIFKQPYRLPEVVFTSFVDVNNKQELDNLLNKTDQNKIEVLKKEIVDDTDVEHFHSHIKDFEKTESEPSTTTVNEELSNKNPDKPVSHAKQADNNNDNTKNKNKKRREKQKEKKKESKGKGVVDAGLEGFLEAAATMDDSSLLESLNEDDD